VGVVTAVAVRPAAPAAGEAGWWAGLWRELSPRRTVRVDRGLVHVYESAEWAELGEVPLLPYAVYLTGADRRFRLLPFDLDPARGDVDVSCRRLCAVLDDAGVEYVVAASGPAGGRHVWTVWPQGLDAAAVRRLTGVLQVLAPALDDSALANPATGCVRPIGAPHRHGGRAELVDGLPGRAAAVLRRGNPSDRLAAVWAVLPAELRVQAAGAAVMEPPVDELAARRARLVVRAGGRGRLAGTRRELSADTWRLLTAPVPAGGNASAVLWQCLLRLVFARWSYPDAVRLLADPRVGGLEYLRTARVPSTGTRVPRSAALTGAMLARQWDKAVEEAVVLYRGAPRNTDPVLDDLVRGVQAVAARVDPRRWTGQAGPADRLVLDAVCLLVLTHNVNPVGASVRMVADMTGLGSSTAHRTLARLAEPDATGRVWLQRADESEGRLAATWRLLDVDSAESTLLESDKQVSESPCVDGTQGAPAPAGGPALGVDLAVELRVRLDHQRADVWTPRGGLGHHAARTHTALLSGPRSLLDLAYATGYSVRTVLEHLRRLVLLGLAIVDGSTVAATERPLVEAARALGVAGRRAARRLRHTVEREVLAWWTAELAWRRQRGKRARRDRRGRRRGRRGPPGPAAGGNQVVLPIAVGPRHTYGRFPVHAGGPKRGRADYAGAYTVVHAHLTRHPHATRPGA
jgi:hypothetical protein